MRCFGEDTRPEIEAMLLERIRQMTPEEKLARVDDLTTAARTLAAAKIREEHPELDDREVTLRVAERLYGRELVAKVRL